ncbi:MAG TPA: hypothetical protein VMB23_03070, partial [Spirochaetia bacterium]|nr:hypothetical protein [Spirochaetia bacterium]
LRDACLVYDWLYERLTPAQRSEIATYVARIEGELWDFRARDPGHPGGSGWGINDTGNNYHWSHIQGLTYAAAAFSPQESAPQPNLYLYDQLADPASFHTYSNYRAFLDAKLAVDLPRLELVASGGGWAEGDSYGNYAKTHMMETFLVLAGTLGRDEFPGFPTEASRYFLFATQPAPDDTGPSWWSTPKAPLTNSESGDMPNSGWLVRDPDRLVAEEMAAGLGDTPEAGMLRSWISHQYPTMTAWRDVFGLDFLFDGDRGPQTDLGVLPLAYFSPGIGWLNSRSDWHPGGSSVSVTVTSSDRVQSHQHEDANSIELYYKGWLVGDAGPVAKAYPGLEAWYHSEVLVEGQEQRASYSQDQSGLPDTIRPSGRVLRHEERGDYAYFWGDASDAFYSQVSHYGTGVDRLLFTNQREVVHWRPKTVVVYDRVTPQLPSVSVAVQTVTIGMPTMVGPSARYDNGTGGRLFQTVLLPSSAQVSVEPVSPQEDALAIRVRDPNHPVNQRFLEVLEACDDSESTPDGTTPILATGGMEGVRLGDTQHPGIVLFSADPVGAPPPGAISYPFSPSEGTEWNLICDLSPGSSYSVTVDSGTLTVTPGGPWVVSTAGTLEFRVSGSQVSAP